MPFGSVSLIPGVNAERTPTLLRAGFVGGQLIRFKDGLVQKLGGWSRLFAFAVSGIPRSMHPWQDINGIDRLAVGTTAQLNSLQSGVLTRITPETITSSPVANLATTAGSPLVSVTDTNISNLTIYDSVIFNVPVSIGGLVLDGVYPISVITGASSYQITAPSNAASSTAVLAMPVFTTTSGNALVSVALASHGLTSADTVVFQIPTTFNGVTISGAYRVTQIVNSNTFTITVATQATASSSLAMNGGHPQFVYYITAGAPALGSGFGLGGVGTGGFGTGSVAGSQTGTPITASDWTLDNWGETLLACPHNGPIFYWNPTASFQQAALIAQAPIINSGMFVSMAEQIAIAYGCSVHEGIGYDQQALLVSWSTDGDFLNWTASGQTQAGNFTIPTGSLIVSGMAGSNQNLLWTDLDLWAMTYIGPPDVFGFNKIGAGAGLVSQAAAQQFRGSVFWMGQSNFYSYTSNGVAAMPCPVWDAVFQNLNTDFLQNVRAMPNTPYNEVGWLYPSAASVSGECDSYVKVNITEPGTPWDYGPMQRSAWVDQSELGPPIGATANGIIYQHEVSPDADTGPVLAQFTTSYFYIAEGEDFAFVDQVYPDFRWQSFSGTTSAQIQLTFLVIDNLGDTPRSFGPYTVTQASNIVAVRFRGRQMALQVESSDVGSFWRIGHIRYRYAPMGRR